MNEATARNEVTRTLAVAAIEDATEAKAGVTLLERAFKRIKWTWGSLLLIAAMFGAGYMARDKMDHYATKKEVAEHSERIELLEKWKEQKDAHERSRDEVMERMANQLDDIHRYFMRK